MVWKLCTKDSDFSLQRLLAHNLQYTYLLLARVEQLQTSSLGNATWCFQAGERDGYPKEETQGSYGSLSLERPDYRKKKVLRPGIAYLKIIGFQWVVFL